MADRIRVEVAYAELDRQFLRVVELDQGATVADAISVSGVEDDFRIDVSSLDFGIWSKPVALEAEVSAGDRVEIYRPLKIDPKEARRKRARNKTP